MLLVDGRVVWKNGVDTAADLSDVLVGDLMAAYELGYNRCRCPGLTGTLAFLPKETRTIPVRVYRPSGY